MLLRLGMALLLSLGFFRLADASLDLLHCSLNLNLQTRQTKFLCNKRAIPLPKQHDLVGLALFELPLSLLLWRTRIFLGTSDLLS